MASSSTWRDLLPPADDAERGLRLALGVELRRLSATTGSQWSPRRAEAVTPRALASGEPRLHVGLRPLQANAHDDGWIKGDVSWDALRRPGGPYAPAQARWFAELHSIAHEVRRIGAFADVSEWITLDTVESGLLWPHLATAERLGIPLVATKRHTAAAFAHADLSVDIGPADDGGLTLSLRAALDGQEVAASDLRPVGRTGVYAVEQRGSGILLRFAPHALGDPVRTLLDAGGALVVPDAEAQEFLVTMYPRLARRVATTARHGLELPPAAPPMLVVAAVFRPGDVVDYALWWDYPGLPRVDYDDPGTDRALDRDSTAEAAVRSLVEATWHGSSTVPFAPAATLGDADTAEFAHRVLPALGELDGIRLEVRGRRRPYRELEGVPEITVSTVETTDRDWFDLGVIVRIDGRSIPFTPLFTALSLRRKKMLLADGRYFSLAHPALDRLRDLIDDSTDLVEWETGPRISRHQLALWEDFEDLADRSEPAVSWRALARGLRESEGVVRTRPPTALRAQLRPYQQEGLDRLAFLWRHRLGGILADDMGLGKTLQVLALVAHAKEQGETRPFLVVAPTTVLSTWRTEAERFIPDLRVSVVDATGRRRTHSVHRDAAEADIVVTSYTLLRLDEPDFTGVEWAGVVLDEAQFVKNPRTRLHRAAKALRTDATFAVTGTPLENSLEELWALLALTAPGLFASARRFREEYVRPIEHGKVPENQEGGPFRAARLERLRRRIRPLVVRRTKESVAPELPEKQEQELRIELAPAHRVLYDTVLQRERQKILGLLDDLDRSRFIVFRSLTLLRLLSLDPMLVDPDHSGIPSAKLDVLLDHVAEAAAEGHRVLVFSQFTSFLALARGRLDAAGIPYAYLDGSSTHRERIVDSFRSGEAPAFLISLKAGGFGLTLTEADYVFLLDPWWNPAAETQAIDRTHRIGQTRKVVVYRMIAADTIEEKVMALQRRKAELFSSVMDDNGLFGEQLSADDIRGLLGPWSARPDQLTGHG